MTVSFLLNRNEKIYLKVLQSCTLDYKMDKTDPNVLRPGQDYILEVQTANGEYFSTHFDFTQDYQYELTPSFSQNIGYIVGVAVATSLAMMAMVVYVQFKKIHEYKKIRDE